jgi:hypothetical protein
MKVKIRCFIKISLLLLFIFNDQYLFSQITPAQQEMATNMIKYWYYRDRLKYFVVPATGPIVYEGESDIACVRNSWANSYYGGNLENLDYGQHGKYTGFYIGTLATQYYLLKQNGQDTDAAHTLNELYYSLT